MAPNPDARATDRTPLNLRIDPANVAEILWRGRRLVAYSVVGCLALACGYLMLARRQYQAVAKVLVLHSGSSPLALDGNQGPLIRGAEDEIPTHAMIVSSPAVVRRAVEAVGLNNMPSLDAEGSVELATREISENLVVGRPDRMAKILNISYKARSAEEAVRVVRAVADSYRAFVEEVYARDNSEVVVLMSRARDELNNDLKGLETKYLDLRRKAPHLTNDGTGRTAAQHRMDEWDRVAREAMVKTVQLKAQVALGNQLARENAGLWSISYALEQLAGGGGGGLASRSQMMPTAGPSDYLRGLSIEQQQLADRLGPDSTRVKEIQEQISNAQSRTQRTRGRLDEADARELLTSIGKSLESVETMRAEMQTRYDEALKLAKAEETDQLAETNLKNEMARQQKLFDTVVEQLNRAKLSGDFSATRSQVIDEPYALPKPVWPKASLVLAMALGAGCVLGIGTALGAELVDPRVRSVAEMRRALALPALGEPPLVPDTLAPTSGPIGLICHAVPRSPSAEAYRVIRANLDRRRGRDARVVMVAGPGGGEGASTVASNLAIAMAQAGRRVLLVDANLRSPTLHATFGLSRGRGLVHLLRGLMTADRVIQATAVEGLDLVASGPEVANPAELLSSAGLGEALAQFRTGYDVVMVDVPSLLGVADASIVGAAADAMVLVVRIATTKRADLARAVESLEGLGTPVLGAVINGSPPGPSRPGWSNAGSAEIPHDPRISAASFLAGGDADPLHRSFPELPESWQS